MEEAGLSQDAQLAGMAGQPWVQKPIGMNAWGPMVRDILMKAAQYGMGGIGGGAGAGAGGYMGGGNAAGLGNWGQTVAGGNNMNWMNILGNDANEDQQRSNQWSQENKYKYYPDLYPK
jgi:hypothetical protein